jgi:hypothetical protein
MPVSAESNRIGIRKRTTNARVLFVPQLSYRLVRASRELRGSEPFAERVVLCSLRDAAYHAVHDRELARKGRSDERKGSDQCREDHRGHTMHGCG